MNLHKHSNSVVPLAVGMMLSESENEKSLRGNDFVCPSEVFTSFFSISKFKRRLVPIPVSGVCFTYF